MFYCSTELAYRDFASALKTRQDQKTAGLSRQAATQFVAQAAPVNQTVVC